MHTPDISRLVMNFKTSVIMRTRAEYRDDRGEGIYHTRKIHEHGHALQLAKSKGVEALCIMCTDDDPEIRYFAACMVLHFMPMFAQKTLMRLTCRPGTLGNRASAALEVWFTGSWPF